MISKLHKEEKGVCNINEKVMTTDEGFNILV